jgi:hypothetical protein
MIIDELVLCGGVCGATTALIIAVIAAAFRHYRSGSC